jgi:hypothetical protein
MLPLPVTGRYNFRVIITWYITKGTSNAWACRFDPMSGGVAQNSGKEVKLKALQRVTLVL